jgi:PAS domain S-box-containing protein
MLKYKYFFVLTILYLFCSFFLAEAYADSHEHPPGQPEFTKPERTFLENHPTLRVQSALNWAPYNFTEAGKVKGFVNDYLRLLAKKLGIQFDFVADHSWSEFMQMLQTDEIDLISNMTVTPDRNKLFLFSNQPVFDVLNGLLTIDSNSHLADLEALQGKTLAVVKGYSQEELLRRYYPDIPLLLTDDLLDSMKQVMAGKAAAAIGAHSVFNFLATKHLIFEVQSTPITGNDIFPSAPHHLAVNKNNPNLMAVLDHGMAMITDAELHELRNKWLNSALSRKKESQQLSFSREEQAYLTSKGKITMCVDPDWLPLEKIEQGKHIGMAADYIQLLENNIGIPISLIPTENWTESMEYAKSRKCDIYSLAMSTPERRTYMFFSEPYLKIPLVVASRANTPFVDNITALEDKKLGVVTGYAFGELLRNKYPKMQIIDVPSLNEGLQMVANNEIYGCIGTLATIGYSIQQNFIGELKVAGKFDEQWKLGIATRNDEPLLLPIFNKAIAEIDEETQQHILNKWISVTIDRGTDYNLLWRFLSLAAIAVLFLLYRSLALGRYNKQLKQQNIEINRQAELLKKTQTALLLTQQAVDSCAFPICWLRSASELAQTTLIHVNQAAADLLGYSRDELLQLSITDFDTEQTSHSWKKLRRILQENHSLAKHSIFTRKDGSTFPAELYISSFTYDDESFHFIFFTDVSKEKEMEKKLHRSMKMEAIGTMAGGVAHDLNNILSGVVSYPELLLLKLPPDSDLRGPLEIIRQAGLRAAEMVADMLTVTRGVAAVKEPANLNSLINEYFDSPECQKTRDQYPSIQCSKILDPELLNISCSQLHIRKCLMNLTTNAAEAIEGEGEVTIATSNQYIDEPVAKHQFIAKGEYVLLTVNDNGPGIPDKFIPHIFEPFYTKKIMGKSGTGLGLSIVWNTVQDHGGTIKVKSSDKGTTFTLYFPATRTSLSSDLQEQVTETMEGDGQHILVIDDEPQQRDICQQMLRALHYQVDVAASGDDALQFLSKQPVDLLVIDMIMDPGLNGMETYEKAIEIHPGQKAIIVSGFSQSDNVAKTQAMGAGQYIRKPYSLHQLGMAVKEALKDSI